MTYLERVDQLINELVRAKDAYAKEYKVYLEDQERSSATVSLNRLTTARRAWEDASNEYHRFSYLMREDNVNPLDPIRDFR